MLDSVTATTTDSNDATSDQRFQSANSSKPVVWHSQLSRDNLMSSTNDLYFQSPKPTTSFSYSNSSSISPLQKPKILAQKQTSTKLQQLKPTTIPAYDSGTAADKCSPGKKRQIIKIVEF